MFDVVVLTIRHSMAVLREEGRIETRRGHHAGTYVAPDVLIRIRELTATRSSSTPSAAFGSSAPRRTPPHNE